MCDNVFFVRYGWNHFQPTAPFDPSGDLLIIPGAPQLWRHAQLPPNLTQTLQRWQKAGKTLVTVCTGAVLAAATGVLKGRNVTTNHLAFEAIQQYGVNLITTARVVDDGNVISSAGVTSGIDLALYLIERYYGAQLAIATEQIIECERRGVVWRAQ